jgi:hypothetical protein
VIVRKAAGDVYAATVDDKVREVVGVVCVFGWSFYCLACCFGAYFGG